MADLDTIRKRLNYYILDRGKTYRDLSLKIGRRDCYIQQYVKYGLPRRLSEIDRKKICAILKIDERELIDDELGRYDDQALVNDVTEPSSVDICRLNRAIISGIEVVGRMLLQPQLFIEWIGTEPHNLKLIRNESDTMEPTYKTGCFLLCDSSVKTYTGDGVYVVFIDGVAVLKRVQSTADGFYTMVVDNPQYQSMRVRQEDTEVFGKVIGRFL